MDPNKKKQTGFDITNRKNKLQTHERVINTSFQYDISNRYPNIMRRNRFSHVSQSSELPTIQENRLLTTDELIKYYLIQKQCTKVPFFHTFKSNNKPNTNEMKYKPTRGILKTNTTREFDRITFARFRGESSGLQNTSARFASPVNVLSTSAITKNVSFKKEEMKPSSSNQIPRNTATTSGTLKRPAPNKANKPAPKSAKKYYPTKL